jgi:hypothetical protein
VSRALRTPLLLALAVLLLPGCALGRGERAARPTGLAAEARSVLGSERATAQIQRDWERLESMGPALDPVLVALARDGTARPVARANALVMLADRRAPQALDVLREALLSDRSERVRAGAVIALQRLGPEADEVQQVLRTATADRHWQVRLTALQALDPMDVGTVRAVMRRERNGTVRAVAREILMLAETRGVPWERGPAGTFSTIAPPGQPRLVFRPLREDPAISLIVGELAVQMPAGPLLPIAFNVTTLRDVVPAFFSPDRRSIVFETGGRVYVRTLRTGQVRDLGPGIAPRPVPLSPYLVFLRETTPPGQPAEPGHQSVERRYEVRRAHFVEAETQRLGELRATTSGAHFGGYSPVRWMVVADVPEGFVLRGEGVGPFPLPSPFSGPPAAARQPSRVEPVQPDTP